MKTNFKRNVGIILTVAISLSLAMPAISAFIADGESGTQYYLVEFKELPSTQLRNAMASSGIEFQDYHQDNTYLIKTAGNPSENALVARFAANIEPYSQEMKISDNVLSAQGQTNLRINLHDGVEVPSTIAALENMGATINRVNTISVNYIRCTVDSNKIAAISEIDDVEFIELDTEPIAFMNLISSNTYMGIDTPQSFGFTGTGMLGEVQDNGIDRNHPDLAGVVFTDGSVVVDHHGTCTSGIVFGNGAGDINALGIAPDATGVFADWGTGRALSVANLWNGDFNEGTTPLNGVVQSNSWSQGTCDGQYGIYAAEDDQAMVDNPRVLTLWAAANSNDGTEEGRISEDSAAKNVICVGAIFHKNTANMADDQYLEQQDGNTPSRGPAADGRQKPDLAGCFDWIYTVDCLGSDGYDTGSDYYDNFGGTSGATPEVAGCSLLAYEMYQEDYFGNNPTNAIPYSSTIKALMIADAHQYPLTGTYSATRTCQGWGTPDMENMYNLGAEYHQIDEYPQALDSGDSYSRQIYSDGVNPLKISLVWTDPAAPSTTVSARALINNLDLKVTSPGGAIYYGNNGLWDNLYSTSGTAVNHWSLSSSYRDDLNNVENVFIQSPQTGLWTIEVSARTGDVAQGPQDFSLVASGAMIPISSEGRIELDSDIYLREATVTIEVQDRDLNTNTGSIQTVNVNLKSNAEPAGETTVLTETGPDTSIFVGTKTISATNSAGVLLVNADDLITATYNDATGPTVVTDTAVVDGQPPASPSGLTVQHWGPDTDLGTPTTEARYLRGVASEVTVNGLSTYSLGTEQSATAGNWAVGNNANVYLGMRVYKRSSGGTETEITTNLVAQVSRTLTGSGFQTATWTPPVTTLDAGDSIVIKVYGATTANPTTVRATFTTEQLGPAQLEASEWSVQYWTRRAGTSQGGSDWYWGTATYDNHISGFQYRAMTSTDPLYHNTLNWTHSGSDVDHFNIYRSASEFGPYSVIDTVPVGTNTYCDLYKGQADTTYWWYRVAAVDPMGNEDTNTNSVQEPNGVEPPTGYDIDLTGYAAGDWAFISFPIDISGEIETVLADAGGTDWDVAKYWDGVSQRWLTHRKGSVSNTFNTINNQMGVWIHLTAVVGNKLTTSVSGDFPASLVQITLYTGWNMVGYPSQTSMTANAALTGTGATMVAVYTASSPYIQDYTNLNSVTVSHGHAYWVFVPATTTWNVPIP